MVELAMMLWDMAGSEEFERVRGSYLRGARGAVWVCDLTRPETLDSLSLYMDILSRVSPDVQLVLAANKQDLADQRRITARQIKAVAAKVGAPYYLTSAKTGDDVDRLFSHLGRLLVG
jgi:small GTP-binding protein